MPEEKIDLERVMKEKIEPILDSAMHKYLGVSISEMKEDLASKLKRPWISYTVDTSIPFKKAKLLFKKEYLQKLLLLHFGNVSEVARLAGINRRSIHRIIAEVGIDVEKIRREMVRKYDLKQEAVSHVIGQVLDNYKTILHPERLERMYENMHHVTDEVLEELPEVPLTLQEMELEFEKKYFEDALKKYKYNISATARAIGIRYETLHRKVKELEIIIQKPSTENQ